MDKDFVHVLTACPLAAEETKALLLRSTEVLYAKHICSPLRQEAEISRHIGTGLLPQEPANRGSTIS